MENPDESRRVFEPLGDLLARAKLGPVKPFRPHAYWNPGLKLLNVCVRDASYCAHNLHPQHVCDLHVVNYPKGMGERVGEHLSSGFAVWVADWFPHFWKMSGQWRWGSRYSQYRDNWNRHKTKLSVSKIIAQVEWQFPDLFGKYHDDLWAMIRRHNLKVHIPLP